MFYAASTRRFCRKSNGTHATPRKPHRCVAFRFTKSTPPRRKMTVLRMWHRESHTACNPRPRQQPGGFRLPSPPPSPMCAPVRRGFVPVASAGPQQTASYGNRQGALADRSAAAFAFSPRRPPWPWRMLAAAFGLAGSSAIKTGGNNRLAGKTACPGEGRDELGT